MELVCLRDLKPWNDSKFKNGSQFMIVCITTYHVVSGNRDALDCIEPMVDAVASCHLNDCRSADPQRLRSSMVQRCPRLCMSKTPNDDRQSYLCKALRLYVGLLSSASRHTSDTARWLLRLVWFYKTQLPGLL
jgi:hypothetical protein